MHTSEYPRPTMKRKRWHSLCGEWGFAFDDHDRGRDEHWQERPSVFDKRINVPFPPESKLSGIGDTGFHPVIWYRRELQATHAEGERLLLHFGAVDYAAEVFIDGRFVMQHVGGHTPFTVDLSTIVKPGDTFVVVVRAEDQPEAIDRPRGKQDWQETPHRIWYNRTSGIWQPVWLEPVPATYIEKVHLTPDLLSHRVTVHTWLAGNQRSEEQQITIDIRLEDEVLASVTARADGKSAEVPVHIPALGHAQSRSRLVWSPESPNLLDVSISYRSGGAQVDRVDTYFGMRDCGVAHGRFTLNGSPYFVRSVLEQGYWPDSHLAAPDAAALKQEVKLIKALGFNAVRIHQKVEDPRFLYWCDVLGVLVWGEMPSAYTYSSDMVEGFASEWMEVVDRDRSHPSIVTWVPLNESWGVHEIARKPEQQAFATSLYWLTKSLDSSRPVISNDGWEHTISDILGIHDYSIAGEHLAEHYGSEAKTQTTIGGYGPQRREIAVGPSSNADIPVMITEFGGLSFQPQQGQAWFGYETVETPDDYLTVLASLFDALHASPVLAGYCYTQLTDTMQETNGLLDEDRKPKLAIEKIREIITRPAKAIPAERLDKSRARAAAVATTSENAQG